MTQPSATLVAHRHVPTFEDVLREALRNAPYLGIALLVHLAVLLVLMSLKEQLPTPDLARAIRATLPDKVFTAPVEEIVPPKDLLVEPDDTVIEDPSDAVAFDEPSLVESSRDPSTEAATTRGNPSILGLGVGPPPGGGTGPGGPLGTGSTRAPTAGGVLRGLEWLAAHQAPGGFWSCANFDDQCGRQGTDTFCDGRGNPRFDVGVTALALLAFLGADNTDKRGEYAHVVKSGLAYLRDVQAPDGTFAGPENLQGTYDDAIATLALCDAYARSGTYQLRRPAQRAVDALVAQRTPGSGWRYRFDHPEMADPATQSDSSVTGWAVLALITARHAGLQIDETALLDGLAFLDAMTDPATGRTGYMRRGEGPSREVGTDLTWPQSESESLTAVAMLCRLLHDPALQEPGWGVLVARGADRLAALPPIWSDDRPGRRDFYAWYYGAYALYLHGSPAWRTWERAIVDEIMEAQHLTGERMGSWDPQLDPWGHLGGRVYSTAILTLTLEVYFRYETLLGERR